MELETKEDFKTVVFPSDWEEKTMSSIGSFSKGKGIKKDEVKPSGLPCVRYGELYTKYDSVINKIGTFINEETAKESKLVKSGDILFAGSGEKREEIGKSAVLDIEGGCYAGGDIVVLRPREDDPIFLGYLFNSTSVAREKSINGQGDAVVHIYSSGLSKVKVHLPPTIEEQQAIAKVLSDTDKLIQALEKKIEKKKLIKQGAMQRLLTPKEDWLEKPLPQVVDYIHGKAHEQDISKYGRYIVVNSKFISTNGKVIKRSSENNCPAQRDDILTVLSDIPNGKALAKCYYVSDDNEYTVNQRICIWRSKGDYSRFLYYILNRHSHFLALNDGVNQTNVGNPDIEKCVLMLPKTREEQVDIASILDDIQIEIETEESRLSKIKVIKQALMQQLLTGKIRLV